MGSPRVEDNERGEAKATEALLLELTRRNIPFEREKELSIIYKGSPLKQTYKADFVCYDKVIVELKAVSDLADSHRSQVYNYLHATGLALGLLFNFGHFGSLERERIICG